MDKKAFRFDCKSLDETGTFEGYLSTWDKDEGGDIIVPGAFKVTLEKWALKGRPVPMLWSHNSEEPIGAFTELREEDKGLFVKGQLALGVKRAAEIYDLMKMKVVSAMSIGYSALQWEMTESARLLKEVRLWEGSLTLWPMNPMAEVTTVKETQAPAESGPAATVPPEPGPGHSDAAVKALLAQMQETRNLLSARR